MKRSIWPWTLAVSVFAADRMTKILAVKIPESGQVLIPGIIGLRYAKNRGIAFSLLSGAPWALGLLSLVIIAAAFCILRKKDLHPLAITGLMMMLGGAVGNMADRLFLGYVPDMIEFLFMEFAVFNVADIFLCIGCGLVMIQLLFGGRK